MQSVLAYVIGYGIFSPSGVLAASYSGISGQKQVPAGNALSTWLQPGTDGPIAQLVRARP